MIFAAGGALAMLVGACMLYLGSPNQSWLKRTGANRMLVWAGGAMSLGGQILLWTWAGPATAVFIGLCLTMTVLTLAPLLTGYIRSGGIRL